MEIREFCYLYVQINESMIRQLVYCLDFYRQLSNSTKLICDILLSFIYILIISMDQKQSGSRSTRSNRSNTTHNSNDSQKYFTYALPKSVEKCEQENQRQPSIMLQQICSRILTNILQGNQLKVNHFCNMLENSDLKALFIRLTESYFQRAKRKSILSNKQIGEQNYNQTNLLLFRLAKEQMFDLSINISDYRIRKIDFQPICKVIKMTNQSKTFRMMMRNKKKPNTFAIKQMFIEQEFILAFKYLERMLYNQDELLSQAQNKEKLQNISYQQKELLLITTKIQTLSQFNSDIQEDINIKQDKIGILDIKQKSIKQQCQLLEIKRNLLTKQLCQMKQQALQEKQEQIKWTITTLMKQLKQKQQSTLHLSTEINKKQRQIQLLKIQNNNHEQSIRKIFQNIQYQLFQKKRQHQIQLQQYKHQLDFFRQKCEYYQNQLQEIKFKRIQTDGKHKFPSYLNQSFDTNTLSNNNYLNFVFEYSIQLEVPEDREASMSLSRSVLQQRNLSSKISHMEKQMHHQRQIAKQQKSQSQGKMKKIQAMNDDLESQLEKLKQKYEQSQIIQTTYKQELYSIKYQLNRAKDELHRLNEENLRSKDELPRLYQQKSIAEEKLRELLAKVQKCKCDIPSSHLIPSGSELSMRKVTASEIFIYVRSYFKKLNPKQRDQLQQKLKKIIQDK